MAFENLDVDDEMGPEPEEETPPEETSNRTFLIVAGVLGAIAILALICIALFALVWLPANRRAEQQQQATVDAQNTQVALIINSNIQSKFLQPGCLPARAEDLQIEQAIARQVMQSAIKMASRGFPAQALSQGEGLLPWVEPILATGSVLTQTPSLAQSALMLLDGLQPTGVTTLVLDQNQIAPALGAAAAVNPLLAVQVLESNSFIHLGTVVSPVGFSRPGTPVMQLKLIYQSSHETTLEVKQGALEVLPLPPGQNARLQLQPLHRYDVGMGAPGRGGSLRVMGGALGVIIDARGRPLELPDDHKVRRELLSKWLSALGG